MSHGDMAEDEAEYLYRELVDRPICVDDVPYHCESLLEGELQCQALMNTVSNGIVFHSDPGEYCVQHRQ